MLEDIPGTQVFTGALSRRGFALNEFSMSLMKPENRARFLRDEPSYLDDWALTPVQRKAVLERDYRSLIAEGGNIFFILKIAATDGRSVQSVVASFTDQTHEEYAAMMLAGGRPPLGLASRSRRR